MLVARLNAFDLLQFSTELERWICSKSQIVARRSLTDVNEGELVESLDWLSLVNRKM